MSVTDKERIDRLERLLKSLCDTIAKHEEGLAGDWGNISLWGQARVIRSELSAESTSPAY
jgi:hypothetical protein